MDEKTADIPPAGTPLTEEELARRAWLPLKPAPVELHGRLVRLAPLVLDRDSEALFAVSNGHAVRIGDREIERYDAEALIWRFMSGGPFATAAELASWLTNQAEGANSLALCVFDAGSGAPMGVATYLNNSPADLKVELGNIWYSPLMQGSGANAEATYLMLRHAFALGYRRVEWKCDSQNERSRRAALRIGFVFEGIQEYHYIVKGRNRDTAWFRLLDREWPAVQAKLELQLAR